jgi:hypothetical protein
LLSTPEDASSTSDISEATQESYSLAEERPGWVKMPKPLCDKCQGFEHPGEPCQERCADCCRDSNYCICRNEPHMGGLGWTMGHALYTVGCTARNVFFKEVKTVEKKTGEWLYDNGLKLYEAHHWVQLLPLDWFDHPWCKSTYENKLSTRQYSGFGSGFTLHVSFVSFVLSHVPLELHFIYLCTLAFREISQKL